MPLQAICANERRVKAHLQSAIGLLAFAAFLASRLYESRTLLQSNHELRLFTPIAP